MEMIRETVYYFPVCYIMKCKMLPFLELFLSSLYAMLHMY